MSAPGRKLNVLLIRSWIHPLAPLRAALHDSAIDARFTRIDIEPALNAALARGGYDLALHDPATPGLSRAAVEACMRAHRSTMPLIEVGDLETVAERIEAALAALRH